MALTPPTTTTTTTTLRLLLIGLTFTPMGQTNQLPYLRNLCAACGSLTSSNTGNLRESTEVFSSPLVRDKRSSSINAAFHLNPAQVLATGQVDKSNLFSLNNNSGLANVAAFRIRYQIGVENVFKEDDSDEFGVDPLKLSDEKLFVDKRKQFLNLPFLKFLMVKSLLHQLEDNGRNHFCPSVAVSNRHLLASTSCLKLITWKRYYKIRDLRIYDQPIAIGEANAKYLELKSPRVLYYFQNPKTRFRWAYKDPDSSLELVLLATDQKLFPDFHPVAPICIAEPSTNFPADKVLMDMVWDGKHGIAFVGTKLQSGGKECKSSDNSAVETFCAQGDQKNVDILCAEEEESNGGGRNGILGRRRYLGVSVVFDQRIQAFVLAGLDRRFTESPKFCAATEPKTMTYSDIARYSKWITQVVKRCF